MNIIKLNKTSPQSYFDEIAQLHISEIHHGLLPCLGEKLLSRFYFESSQISNMFLWIAEDEGRVSGFILGSSNFKTSYLKLLKKAWFSFLRLGIRTIFSKEVLKKLLTVLLYPFRNHSKENNSLPIKSHAELLSIAIHASARKRGLGKSLILALEKSFIDHGQIEAYFVATNSEDPDSNAFYRKMGFTPYGKQSHNDLILQVYQKEITSI